MISGMFLKIFLNEKKCYSRFWIENFFKIEMISRIEPDVSEMKKKIMKKLYKSVLNSNYLSFDWSEIAVRYKVVSELRLGA